MDGLTEQTAAALAANPPVSRAAKKPTIMDHIAQALAGVHLGPGIPAHRATVAQRS